MVCVRSGVELMWTAGFGHRVQDLLWGGGGG